MAIAKMNKIKLIALQPNKENLLTSLQGMQSIELIDMSAEYKHVRAVNRHQRDHIENQVKVLENKYAAYQDHLSFLQSHLPKISFFSKMKEERLGFTIQELEKESDAVDEIKIIASIEKAREAIKKTEETLQNIKNDQTFLEKWEKLSHVPNIFKKNDYIQSLTGTVPQTAADDFIRTIRGSELLYVEDVYQTRDEYGITVAFDVNEKSDVQDLLEKNHFLPIDYRFQQSPKAEWKELDKEKNDLQVQLKGTKADLATMKETESALHILIETIYARLQRLQGQLLLMDEPNLFILEGWVESNKVPLIKENLAGFLAHQDYALIVEEVKEEEIDKVPIVLENNRFVEPFENITSMYSLPKYNEIDPTPFLMPFYLVFFGMMVADAGYGLLMMIATTVALKVFNLNKGMQKNMRFFQLLSYSTIGWGLIYGSFFGLELPFVLLSIMEDVNTILVISVVFGVIQILLGLSIKTYLMFKDKDIYGAISDGIGWLTIFAGIILLVVANLVFPNALLSTIGGWVAILGAVAIIVASALGSKNKALGAGLGLYNLYGITGYVGDIVSYTRLMALGVSGGSIALAFNMIIDFLPTGARFTVGIFLFIILHSVNIGLSSLSAYVHGARLIFVEFFGKFYEGGGKALEPLKTSEEYIDLKNNLEA